MISFLSFDVFLTSSLTGYLFDSDLRAPYFIRPLFTYGSGGDAASMLFLFCDFGLAIGSCLGVFIVSSSVSGMDHVSLIPMFYSVPLFKMYYTRSVQFGSIVPSLMNGNVENSSSKTT